MKRVASFIFIVGVCTAIAGIARADNAGQKIYQKKMCTGCHGAGKPGIDLKDSKKDKKALFEYIKDPSKAEKPNKIMPKFTGSDKDLNDLVDYVMSLRK